jgi:hypothetical protein
MTKAIQTELFYKDTRNCDYEIGHLYEHLLIQDFYETLNADGYIDGLWGWLSGETFDGALFLSAGFYDNSAKKRFINYMQQPPSFSATSIKNAIAHMEAEDDVLITYDMSDITRQLQKIETLGFIRLSGNEDLAIHHDSTQKDLPKSKYLVARKSKKSFQNFSIKIGICNPTNLDKEIFLRLNVVANDVVAGALNQMSAYGYFGEGPIFEEQTDNFIFHYTEQTIAKKHYDEKRILSKLTQELKGVDFTGKKRDLKKYIRGYYLDTSSDFVVDYFRFTGIVTSKYHIYKLFTPKNVQKVWDKLEVKIEPVK